MAWIWQRWGLIVRIWTKDKILLVSLKLKHLACGVGCWCHLLCKSNPMALPTLVLVPFFQHAYTYTYTKSLDSWNIILSGLGLGLGWEVMWKMGTILSSKGLLQGLKLVQILAIGLDKVGWVSINFSRSIVGKGAIWVGRAQYWASLGSAHIACG